MNARRFATEPKPAVALTVAAALHVVLLALISTVRAPVPVSPPPSVGERSIAIELAVDPTTPSNTVGDAPDGYGSRERAPAPTGRSDRSPSAPLAMPSPVNPPDGDAAFGSSDAVPENGEVSGGNGSREPSQPIDLGLEGSFTRAWLLEQRDRPPSSPGESAGGLREGLDALDAERGMARSAPAVSVARGAAIDHGPREGIAVVEVAADATGRVVSVRLVSAGDDESRWRSVVLAMKRDLGGRRLRVPQNARGLVARLRVARGAFAKEVADQWRTERGVAVGQKPLSPMQTLDESTHASERPGALTPTLGGSLRGGAIPTAVTLLSERVL